MEREGDEVHVDTEEASGGDKDRSLGKMLVIGTLLAVVLLSVVWITGAVRFNHANPVMPEPTATS
ncbi:MAG: hypothetical protein WCL10_05835 [Novosphingobium sp.]|uniref:hypothetical protein n=1 Tax=Novosphingobium sp. TaxID=1874826 RepID=UPI00301AA73E